MICTETSFVCGKSRSSQDREPAFPGRYHIIRLFYPVVNPLHSFCEYRYFVRRSGRRLALAAALQIVADADEVAGGVDEGEFTHVPGLVGGGRQAGYAFGGQVEGSEFAVEGVRVGDSPIAA
jgi:hypothetical protein